MRISEFAARIRERRYGKPYLRQDDVDRYMERRQTRRAERQSEPAMEVKEHGTPMDFGGSILHPKAGLYDGQVYPACELAPAGWFCTRPGGHKGPCAAHELLPATPTVPSLEVRDGLIFGGVPYELLRGTYAGRAWLDENGLLQR